MSKSSHSDIDNLERRSSDNDSKTHKGSNNQIKSSSKSPGNKRIKSTQSNTLTGWITKDLSHFQSSKTSKTNVLKDPEHNGENDLKKENLMQEKISKSKKLKSPKKKSKTKNKSRQSNSESDGSENVQKSCRDYFSTDISKAIEGTKASKESTNREKFKNIAMSPLSAKNLGILEEYDKNGNSQKSITSQWLSKHECDSNLNAGTKEKFAKKERVKNVKLTVTEEVSNKNVQIKDSKLKLKSTEVKIRNKSLDCSPEVEIKCDADNESTNKMFSKHKCKEEFSKYFKHVSPRKSVPNPETTASVKKGEENNISIKPKISKSPEKSVSTNSQVVISGSRKLLDVDLFSSSGNVWLSKSIPISKSSQHTKNKTNTLKKSNKKNSKYKKLDVEIKRNQDDEKKKTTLDKYVSKSTKESYKRKLFKSDSKEGENSLPKNNKKSKTNRASESFKKYGVNIPSVEEIIKDQKEFDEYKNQIESFKDIENQSFELPFSVKDLKKSPEIKKSALGCKHISLDDIEKAFHDNLDYISSIFHGKKYSERHERFFKRNVRKYTLTLKDLCYNTSTIAFSFEQMEHLIGLLKKEFDPDDKWTSYFFQVLLPELCLKIFMDEHSMTYDEAVKYLDTRPIED